MAHLLINKIKNKIKQIVGDSSIVIDGHLLDLQTQYIILFEHLRLRYIGFGVQHPFYNLGNNILAKWFELLEAANYKPISKGREFILSELEKEFREEPTDDNLKVRINIDEILGFRFIDLFAGIGGFHTAMHYVGGRCVFASEWDKNARISYEANYKVVEPNLFEKDKNGKYLYFNEDINNAIPAEIPNFDICCGGFPCQPFSVAGLKRGFEDTRGTLFFNIANIVKEKIKAGYPPRVLFLENVRGLKNHDKGETLKVILATLEELGYGYSYEVLNAKYFGVPQNRERLFIIAWYKNIVKVDKFNFPYGIAIDGSTIYEKKKLKEGTLPTKVSDIFEPEETIDGKYTISDGLWEGHKRRKERNKLNGKGFGYSLFNADSVYTSTISARYWKDGSEILIDQSNKGLNPRKLTPVEAGRLQGYRIIGNGWQNSECANNQNYNDKNIEFKIVVSNKEAYHQFGNSVAIPVIKRLAEEIIKQLM